MAETPLTPEQIIATEQSAKKQGYVHRTLVAVDQCANVVLGGNPDETISARSSRAAKRGGKVGKFMVWWLDKLETDHGVKAEAADLGRADAVKKIESDDLGLPK